jgi:hypothetical protein
MELAGDLKSDLQRTVSAAARFWRTNSTSEHDPNIKQVKKKEFKKKLFLF